MNGALIYMGYTAAVYVRSAMLAAVTSECPAAFRRSAPVKSFALALLCSFPNILCASCSIQ